MALLIAVSVSSASPKRHAITNYQHRRAQTDGLKHWERPDELNVNSKPVDGTFCAIETLTVNENIESS